MIHWIKFNVVGALGFALQSGALFVLTHTTMHFTYLAATALAVELAVLHNFVWHQRWTWRDRPAATMLESLRRLAKFNITNGLVSLLGNLAFMAILVGTLSLPIARANLHHRAPSSILNFFLAA